MSEPKYIIGIDLGTTNSVVAYTDANPARGKNPEIHVFQIPQLTGPGVLEKRNLLPSFILTPSPNDVPEGSLELPWNTSPGIAVGAFAKERGADIPSRLISSVKSWLCHSLIDRNQAILPWKGPEDVDKKSPVEATADILRHIRDAWNFVMAAEDPDAMIEKQEILLTVPASFDAVAKDLTVKAAGLAGLSNITLLEEPQAAFYAWIESSGDEWRNQVQPGDTVLVCDVGGGTSDFSLIRVSGESGELGLERIAVGSHLLVGGDNMDLALAYATAKEMAREGKKVSNRQMGGLWHGCRVAKEKILSNPEVMEERVTVLGTGKGLIGGTRVKKISRETVEQVILDGFFPKCDFSDHPEKNRQMGLREHGLAYESDPAVTKHLAEFLNRHSGEESEKRIPDAVLFNGGVMKAGMIRKRISEVLSSWGENEIRQIESNDLDLSVARGAAYYGLARNGMGVRIRSGLARSYYIGVAASIPAVPGMPIPIRALCVAPFGMEEGDQIAIRDNEFVLVVGEPVKFDFLGSNIRLDDQPGEIIDDWEDDIEELTTLETTLEGITGSVIPVYLEVRVTEIGTLELWCVARDSDGSEKWKLEFNVREKESESQNP